MPEIDVQRRNTKAYIDADPTEIALIPWIETTTPSGGQIRKDGAPRAVQTFKRIAMRFDQRPTVTTAGVERIIDYTLMGEWDSTMEVGDRWYDFDGTTYEIVSITEGFGYEKKALCSRYMPK